MPEAAIPQAPEPSQNQAVPKRDADPASQPQQAAEPAGEQAPLQETFPREYVEKLRAENAKYRTRFKEIEDASKSELQLAQEKIAALETQAQAARVTEARAKISASTGIPMALLPEMEDEAQLTAFAQELVKWSGGQAHPARSLPTVASVGKQSEGLSRDEMARNILGLKSY